MKQLVTLTLIIVLTANMVNADNEQKKSSKEQKKDQEDAYNNLTDAEKSARCTKPKGQVDCNKVNHCCYFEHYDPKRAAYQQNCVDWSIFYRYYIEQNDVDTLKNNTPRRTFDEYVTEIGLQNLQGRIASKGGNIELTTKSLFCQQVKADIHFNPDPENSVQNCEHRFNEVLAAKLIYGSGIFFYVLLFLFFN